MALVAVLAAVACSAAGTPTGAPRVVTFLPERISRDADVPNPLRGQYVWEDAPAVPEGRDARDSYKRWLWSEIEPSHGNFDWGRIDKYVAAARRVGGRFGMRIMALSTGDVHRSHLFRGAYSGIPDDLAAAMNPLIASDGVHTHVIPDWNSEAYLSRVEELVAAVGNRYRDEPALGFVDVIGYGNWGEFHLSPFDRRGGAYDGSTQRPVTDANARRIVRANAAAFRGKLVVVPTAQRAALAEAVAATSPSIGLRVDCLGSLGMSGAVRNIDSVPGAASRWRTAPVITEWCPNASVRGALFLNGANQVRRYHVSMLSSGNFPEAPTTGADRNAFDDAHAQSGYRLRVDAATLTLTSSALNVRIRWVNDGVAPTYLPWKVVLGLRGPISAELTMPADLRHVQPDAPLEDRGVLPSTLPPGTYLIYLRVEDAQGISAPMALAQRGRDAVGNQFLGALTVP